MNVLKDDSGAYDLAEVQAITPKSVHDRGGSVKATRAVLHFKSGESVLIATEFDEAFARWSPAPAAAPAAARG
jgi:hypothetical protein